MKKIIFYVVLFNLFFCILLTKATTIDPLTFDELVYTADFVGVVECTKAGGVVAEYKVLKALKSVDSKSTLRIRITPNYWEPQFPTRLVGKKYFVTVYKNNCPSTMMSTTSGGGVPLWNRKIKFDYFTPLFQGFFYLKDEDATKKNIEKFNKLESIPQDQRENHLYNVQVKKYLYDRNTRHSKTEEGQKILKYCNEIKNINTVSGKLDKLFQLVRLNKDKVWTVRNIIRRAGGEKTLQYLKTHTAKELVIDTEDLNYLIEGIRLKLNPKDEVPTQNHEEKSVKPTESEFAEMKKDLFSKKNNRNKDRAFRNLSKYKPEVVVEYLCNWTNPKNSWRDVNLGYVFGSFFAVISEKNRKEFFIKLLKAKNDYIKTSAAVYLCFEDKKQGLTALKKLIQLKGDPGVWAALTLARRGDSSAVPRLLKAFQSVPEYTGGGMNEVPHRNLQKRILILLSNSANFSKVPQPPEMNYRENDNNAYYKLLIKWWNTHKSKIKLIDVWATELDKQKID